MNITATRFATKARTWLLIAGLTALLIVIGSLLGGAFLYLFVGLAIAMNVAGYWFSDKLALRASKAQPVEPGTMPEIEAMVQDLAVRAQVPVPRLYLIPSPAAERVRDRAQPVARGRCGDGGAAAAPAARPGQGRARARVRAHQEPRHPRDVDRRDGLGRDRRDRERHAVLADLRRDDDDSPLGLVGTLVAIIVAPLAATLLQLAVSRQREYLADATGAALLGQAKPLADGLETLERGSQALPMTHLNPAEASLYAVNPLPRGGISSLFMTHPPMQERIRRLRALDGESAIRLVA